MKKKEFLRLNSKWSLGYDNNQWILKRFRSPKWRDVSFVGSSKVVLMSVIEDHGITPTPSSWTMLKSLPDTFLEFYDKEKENKDGGH